MAAASERRGRVLARAACSVLGTVLLAGAAVGCGGTPGAAPSPGISSSPAGGTPGAHQRPSTELALPPAAASARPGTITKLLVFVIENHSLAQMKQGMPFTYSLARKFAYATDFHAIRHPSLPNYLVIAGGSTFGVADDEPPSSHQVRGRSVFGQALESGHTAKVYADGMTSNCMQHDGGNLYAVRHNPWTYFVDEREACDRYDVPLDQLAGDVAAGRLPNAGMVVPNLVHDAHNASLAAADAWLHEQIDMITTGPDWTSGHLAIVVTADEDDGHSGNRILTVVASPAVSQRVVTSRLDHCSLTRFYDEVLGVPPLGCAGKAVSMEAALGLPTP